MSGGSSSSDVTNNETNNITQVTEVTEIYDTESYGFQDADGNVVGDGNTIVYSDQGAIQAATDLALAEQSFLGDTFDQALGFADQVNERSSTLAYDLFNESTEQVSGAYQTGFDGVQDAYDKAGGFVENAFNRSFDEVTDAYRDVGTRIDDVYQSANDRADNLYYDSANRVDTAYGAALDAITSAYDDTGAAYAQSNAQVQAAFETATGSFNVTKILTYGGVAAGVIWATSKFITKG